ncbi:MAG: SufD family Fe-S cluster assembly protein [Patescibacteria group bacterium]
MVRVLKPKTYSVTKDMTLEIDMRKHPAWDFTVTVAAGVQLDVVWLGNNLKKSVCPAIHFMLREKARLRLALSVSRSHEASVRSSIKLIGSGAEAYVSGLFHGFGHDRHILDVAVHHQASNTKGDILIRGVYEDTAYGRFSGLLKIHPGANQTNSYFVDNVLLLDRGMATSIPTLEILANDVRATHGSTTSRVNDDQLFYLKSRGLSTHQAVQHIIRGFFQPILARLPANAEKLFSHSL